MVAAGALSLQNSGGPSQQQRMEGFSGIIGISAGGKKNTGIAGAANKQQGKKPEEPKGFTGPLQIGGTNLTNVNSSSNIRDKLSKVGQNTPSAGANNQNQKPSDQGGKLPLSIVGSGYNGDYSTGVTNGNQGYGLIGVKRR